MGYTNPELLKYYYTIEEVTLKDGKIDVTIDSPYISDVTACKDIVDKKNNIIVKKGKKISRGLAKKIRAANIKKIPMTEEMLEGKV